MPRKRKGDVETTRPGPMAKAIDKGASLSPEFAHTLGRSAKGISNEDDSSNGPREASAGDVVGLMRSAKSVGELVLQAVNLPRLRFFDCAFFAANRSNYRSKKRLAEYLEILSEYGCLQAEHGRVGKDITGWFHERGVDYVPHESEETMRRYGRDFYDSETGFSVTMEEHLRLGAGGNRDEQDIFRIHFRWSHAEKLVLVGHVGRHLPNASS